NLSADLPQARVVLDVVSGDLYVMNVTPQLPDPRSLAVADVVAGDDRLMQIALIEKQTAVEAIVNVRIRQHEIAVPFDEMNPDAAAANRQVLQCCLHRPHEFDAVRRLVPPHDFETRTDRQPLAVPDVLFE